MLQNDELLERIGYRERANRLWKGLAFGLGAALVLFLVLGSLLGFTLYFQDQHERLEAEAAVRQALQQEVVARQQAQEAWERARQEAEKARKAADKQPW
jgi:Tfp pilus assembly protein PilO